MNAQASNTEALTPADFIARHDAMTIMGATHNMLARLVEAGHVRTYRLPGGRQRYHRGDCERIAAEALAQAVPA